METQQRPVELNDEQINWINCMTRPLGGYLNIHQRTYNEAIGPNNGITIYYRGHASGSNRRKGGRMITLKPARFPITETRSQSE
ncbi:hypothetical protein J4402_00900 [Candidatus Pacearchaeota archaeon]|nr:hypothetical protein [Candidatus Pacearchaeota archaeon]